MKKPVYETRACCKMCQSGNIVLRMIYTGKGEDGRHLHSHWYECGSCHYSSPGRKTRGEAIADTVELPIDAENY